jgi:hypothetical protein
MASWCWDEGTCLQLLSKLAVPVVLCKEGGEAGFVTREKLQLELEADLKVHKGKLSITRGYGGVDNVAELVQAAKILAAREDNFKIYFLEQRMELLSQNHVNDIAQQIQRSLQIEGILSVEHLTRQHELPLSFLQHLLSNTPGVAGKEIIPGSLVSDAHLEKEKLRIKEACSLISGPAQISNILNDLHLEDGLLFFHILQDLLECNILAGSLVGREFYIPDGYEDLRRAELDDLLLNGPGYVDLSELKSRAVPNPRNYLESEYPGVLILGSTAVAPTFCSTLAISLNASLSTVGYFDALDQGLGLFTDEDLDAILSLSLKRIEDGAPATLLAGGICVSNLFIEDCRLHASNDLRNRGVLAASQGEVQDALSHWSPEMERRRDLLQAVAQHILSDVSRDLAAEPHPRSDTEDAVAEDEIEEKWLGFQLYLKGCSVHQKRIIEGVVFDPDDFLLRNQGCALADAICRWSVSSARDSPVRNPEHILDWLQFLRAELPASTAELLERMISVCTSGESCAAEFAALLEDAVLPACNLIAKRLDKKREKTLVAALTLQLCKRLEEAIFPDAILLESLHLVFLRTFTAQLAVPDGVAGLQVLMQCVTPVLPHAAAPFFQALSDLIQRREEDGEGVGDRVRQFALDKKLTKKIMVK